MRGRVRYLLLFLAVYGLFLILYLPAVLLKQPLEAALSGPGSPFRFYRLEGTVWAGSTSLGIADRTVDQFHWRLHVLPLLLGRIELGFESRDGEFAGHGTVGRRLSGDLYLQDLELRLPGPWLSAWIPALAPYRPEGYAEVQMEGLEIDNGVPVSMEGTLVWRNAALGLPQSTALGDLRLNAEPDGERTKATLSDGGGPLRAQGLLIIEPDGRYQFNGSLAARDNAQPHLSQRISLLGPPGPDGSVAVSSKGKLGS